MKERVGSKRKKERERGIRNNKKGRESEGVRERECRRKCVCKIEDVLVRIKRNREKEAV